MEVYIRLNSEKIDPLKDLSIRYLDQPLAATGGFQAMIRAHRQSKSTFDVTQVPHS
jgi:hypothetical protein